MLVSTVLTFFCFFFFNDTATTEIYTLSLHDALPISRTGRACRGRRDRWRRSDGAARPLEPSASWRRSCRCRDRKSTRLNSSHLVNSYAVFCLKKKKKKIKLSNTETQHRSIEHCRLHT